MPDKHTCACLCYMCGRPNDTFRHVHLPHTDEKGEQLNKDGEATVVLCIPCVARLSNALNLPIMAYIQGGSVFDRYGRDHAQRLQGRNQGRGQGSQAPQWATDVLKEIEEQQDD
jgi:hypothetical protein